MPVSADETDGGGWLYLLGRIAWRLVQAALVTACVVLVFSVVVPTHAGQTKEKAYIATMKADLRNLVTAQESYFEDYQAYAPSLEVLGTSYTTSTGSTVVIDRGMADGFAATATHNGTPYHCGIFVASAPRHTLGVIVAGSEPLPLRAPARAAPPTMAPPWPGAQEGVPLCWKP